MVGEIRWTGGEETSEEEGIGGGGGGGGVVSSIAYFSETICSLVAPLLTY